MGINTKAFIAGVAAVILAFEITGSDVQASISSTLPKAGIDALFDTYDNASVKKNQKEDPQDTKDTVDTKDAVSTTASAASENTEDSGETANKTASDEEMNSDYSDDSALSGDSLRAGADLYLAANKITLVNEKEAASVSLEEEESVSEEEDDGEANLAVADVSDYVNIREEASTDSKILGKLHKDGVATILEDTGNGWLKIQSGSVTGYIDASFLTTGEEAAQQAEENASHVAEVTTETLRVRAAPDINSDVITLLPEGEKLDVIEELDGWLKVNTDEGEGYISSDYADVETVYQVAESIEEEQARLQAEAEEAEAKAAAEVYSRRQAVVSYAMQFLGNPYVWGGTSLTNGIDCSGFTMQVYAHFGYSLPHYDLSQRHYGTEVESIASALPGDLVFYSGHVAIYAGGGMVIHASNPREGIKTSRANYRTIQCIRRIIQE